MTTNQLITKIGRQRVLTALANVVCQASVVSVATETFAIACSDETTVLSAASTTIPKATFHMPYAFTITRVFAGLTTPGTGASQCIVDIHEAGTTIMSATKILFSASTKLSADGVVTDASIAANALIELFLDQLDANNVAAGLKVYIVGHQ